MHQAELVRRMAQGAGITQPQAAHALRIFLESIQIALRRGERVRLAGFGTFAVRSQAARKGRHPRTGQEIMIPAGNTLRFKAGKRLREAMPSR